MSAFHLSGTSPAYLGDDPAPGTRSGFWDTIRPLGHDQALACDQDPGGRSGRGWVKERDTVEGQKLELDKKKPGSSVSRGVVKTTGVVKTRGVEKTRKVKNNIPRCGLVEHFAVDS